MTRFEEEKKAAYFGLLPVFYFKIDDAIFYTTNELSNLLHVHSKSILYRIKNGLKSEMKKGKRLVLGSDFKDYILDEFKCLSNLPDIEPYDQWLINSNLHDINRINLPPVFGEIRDESFYDASDIAKLLGLSTPATVRLWINSGKLYCQTFITPYKVSGINLKRFLFKRFFKGRV